MIVIEVKIYSAISNKQDIKDLITSLILSQQERYNEDSLIFSVKHYIEGSSIDINEKEIKEMVDRAINVFVNCGEITCINGWYYPNNIL